MKPSPNVQRKRKDTFLNRGDGTFLTPEFRVAFPYIFEKDRNEAYGVVMIFPKETVDMEDLHEAIEEVIAERWPKVRPRGLQLPVHDGDTQNREEYQNAFYINGKGGKYRPGLVDSQFNEITSKEEFYPGCWARATIKLYSYDNKQVGKMGVSVSVNNIMKTRDDEPFTGRVSAAHDFDGLTPPADPNDV